jgi:hypothetical protein
MGAMEEVEHIEVLPLPEVVTSFRQDIKDAIDWDVQSSMGTFGVATDLLKGQMAVPFADDDVSKFIRERELTRARITPTDPLTYDALASKVEFAGNAPKSAIMSLLKASEELRIHTVMSRLNFNLDVLKDDSEKTLGKRLATAGSPQSWDAAVNYAIPLLGTSAFKSFLSGIKSVKPEWADSLKRLERYGNTMEDFDIETLADTRNYEYDDGKIKFTMPNGFTHTLRMAHNASTWLSTGGYAPEDVKQKKADTDTKRAENYGDDEEGEEVTEEVKEALSKMDVTDMPMDYEFPTNGGEGEFAKLHIDDSMPLTQEVSGYIHRKKKSSMTGRTLRYPSRMITDPQKRVFGHKVRVRGGILVIDVSGSMNLTNEDIEAILEVAPAAYIVAYSHRKDGEPNAWILANRGWRVSPERLKMIHGSGNGVDGPALLHGISKRKHGEPVIWVCDGYVTSKNDGFSEQLAVECAKLVKKHRVIMIPSVAEAVKAFRTNKLINKPAGPIREILLHGKSGYC